VLAADATIVPAAIAVGFCVAIAVLVCITAAYLMLGVNRR
jgi:hypothetical protein